MIYEELMKLNLASLEAGFQQIHTGRASAGLVENIRVPCYGGEQPVKQLALVSAPEPNLLVIKPFDPSLANDVCGAVTKANIGVNPQRTGPAIRLPIPPLSEENRKKAVRTIRDEAERHRVALRGIRRDANKISDNKKKRGEISEDECRREKDDIQKMLASFESQVNELLSKKTEQIEAQ